MIVFAVILLKRVVPISRFRWLSRLFLLARQPLLHLGQRFLPFAAESVLAEGIVQQIERFHKVPELIGAFFQLRPRVGRLFGEIREFQRTDPERLGVQREFVLFILPDQRHAALPRPLPRLNRPPGFRQSRRPFVRNRFVARQPARAFQGQTPGDHHGRVGLVEQLDDIRRAIELEPEPHQKFVAEEVAIGFVGDPSDALRSFAESECGWRRIIDLAGPFVQLGELKRPATGGEGFETDAECLLEEGVEPIEIGERSRAEKNFVGLGVPENRDALSFSVAAIFRFVFEAIPRRFFRFAFLPGRR